MAAITLSPSPPSLRVDDAGVIRIGSTRVTLDTIVTAFHAGATPEQIVQDFPSLDLGDVYAAMAYYIHHRDQVDAYIAQGARAADEFRAQSSGLYAADVRQRLLARRNSKRTG